MTHRRIASLALFASVLVAGCDTDVADAEATDTEFRIVGGQQHAGDPAVAFLLAYQEGSNEPSSICSGTLIEKRTLLTAAHCVDQASLGFEPAAIGVYFGTEYSQNDPGFVFYTEAVSYTMHEGFNTNDLENGNDIAVIEVREDVPIQPMPIATQTLTQNDLGAGVRLVGWGLTTSGAQDSGLKRAAGSELYDFNDRLVVVGDTQTNTCSGDSGGPAFMNIGGQDVVVGVTSYGDQNCLEYGVSTRVDAYVDWIAQAMGQAPGGGGGPTGPGTGGGSDGGMGSSCNTHDDCGSGICIEYGQGGVCSAACNSDADCGSGWACYETGDPNLNVCAPADDTDPGAGGNDPGNDGGGSPLAPSGPTDDGDDDDAGADDETGGCSVTATSAPPASLALLALLAFARRRRN